MVSWFVVVKDTVFDPMITNLVPYSVYILVNFFDKTLDCNHSVEFCCHFNNLKERVLIVSFLLFLYDLFNYEYVFYDSISSLYSLLFVTYFNFSHFLDLYIVFCYLCVTFYFRFFIDCFYIFFTFENDCSFCFLTTVIFNLFRSKFSYSLNNLSL